MFAEAMGNGHMEPYFPLMEQFVTQEDPRFCALATLTMVMNSLRIDPRRRWRDENGPGWRWWSDEMFPTSLVRSWEDVAPSGFRFVDIGGVAGHQQLRDAPQMRETLYAEIAVHVSFHALLSAPHSRVAARVYHAPERTRRV